MYEPSAPRPRNADEKFCAQCGSAIHVRAEICPRCGVRQMPPPAMHAVPFHAPALAPNGKSRIAAALLAFFLGGIGIHKFYLGQVGRGILYLLFCWTLIPGIIALVEFILLLVMSDEDFVRKHGYS